MHIELSKHPEHCHPAETYPDNDGEQRPTARGQVNVGVQQILVHVGVR